MGSCKTISLIVLLCFPMVCGENYYGLVGHDYELPCYKGERPLVETYSWQHHAAHANTEYHATTPDLRIRSASVSDSGLYKCSVYTSADQTTTPTHVHTHNVTFVTVTDQQRLLINVTTPDCTQWSVSAVSHVSAVFCPHHVCPFTVNRLYCDHNGIEVVEKMPIALPSSSGSHTPVQPAHQPQGGGASVSGTASNSASNGGATVVGAAGGGAKQGGVATVGGGASVNSAHESAATGGGVASGGVSSVGGGATGGGANDKGGTADKGRASGGVANDKGGAPAVGRASVEEEESVIDSSQSEADYTAPELQLADTANTNTVTGTDTNTNTQPISLSRRAADTYTVHIEVRVTPTADYTPPLCHTLACLAEDLASYRQSVLTQVQQSPSYTTLKLTANISSTFTPLPDARTARCGGGYSTHATGRITFCVGCDPGSYSADGGVCTRCEHGSYQPQYSQGSCVECGGEVTNERTGCTPVAAPRVAEHKQTQTTTPAPHDTTESSDYYSSEFENGVVMDWVESARVTSGTNGFTAWWGLTLICVGVAVILTADWLFPVEERDGFDYEAFRHFLKRHSCWLMLTVIVIAGAGIVCCLSREA